MFSSDDVVNVILSFSSEYELVDWIFMEKLNWYCLSQNPAAIYLLEQNKHKINWDCLCQNPAAIHLLEQYKDKINWYCLSRNPAAIHLLEQNKDKIKLEFFITKSSCYSFIETKPT